MAIIATKVERISGANGAADQLVPDDKLELVKKTYAMVKKTTPDYDHSRQEMRTYEVELSDDYDVAAIS